MSLLKKRIGDGEPVAATLPPFDDYGELVWTPERVLDMAVQRRMKRNVTIWLVQWQGLPAEDATWEVAHLLRAKFPNFGA